MHLLFGVFTVVKISSVPEHGCSVRSREGCLWGEAEDLKWDCLSVDSVSVIGWLLGPRLSSSCHSSHPPQANWSLTLKAKLFYCRSQKERDLQACGFIPKCSVMHLTEIGFHISCLFRFEFLATSS